MCICCGVIVLNMSVDSNLAGGLCPPTVEAARARWLLAGVRGGPGLFFRWTAEGCGPRHPWSRTPAIVAAPRWEFSVGCLWACRPCHLREVVTEHSETKTSHEVCATQFLVGEIQQAKVAAVARACCPRHSSRLDPLNLEGMGDRANPVAWSVLHLDWLQKACP